VIPQVPSKSSGNKKSRRLSTIHSFDELDNWMGIMEVDPPKTAADKWGMYLRLNEIVEGLLARQQKIPVQPLIPPGGRRHFHSIG